MGSNGEPVDSKGDGDSDDSQSVKGEKPNNSGLGRGMSVYVADEERVVQSPLQEKLARIVGNPWFDVFIGAVVCINMALVIMETNDGAKCVKHGTSEYCDPHLGIVLGNWLLLSFYMVELGMQLFVWRRAFFRNCWNIMDMMVVLSSILAEIVGSVARNLKALRLLRLLRVTRIVRLLSNFRELYMMLHGMAATLKAIVWAALLMVGVLTVWSIVAVDVLYPEMLKIEAEGALDDCGEFCLRAFSSVFAADLTFFETAVLGSNWGTLVLPLAFSPSSWAITLFIFFGVFFMVVIGLMNLVLAVVVDFAVDAREEDQNMRSMAKAKVRRDAKQQLMKLCIDLDKDRGGTLSLQEFMAAFDTTKSFQCLMEQMDIDREDLECIFQIMDADNSGDVSYNEFTDLLFKMKTQNSKAVLMFIKHYSMEIKRKVTEEMDVVRTTARMVEQMAYRLNSALPHANFSSGQSAAEAPGVNPYMSDDSALRLSAAKEDACIVMSSWDLPGSVSCSEKEGTEEALPAPAEPPESSDGRPQVVLGAQSSFGGKPKQPQGRGLRSMKTLPEQHALGLPELDRLERLGFQIEMDLAALRSQLTERLDERCDALMRTVCQTGEHIVSLERQAHDRHEMFGKLLQGVQADQKQLLVATRQSLGEPKEASGCTQGFKTCGAAPAGPTSTALIE